MPKLSAAFLAIKKPLHAIRAKAAIIKKDLKNPNSSAATAKTESVIGSGKKLTSNFLKFIDGIQQNFEKDLNLQIEKIVIKDSVFEILVFSKTGMYMIFDTTANLDKQILDAKKALEIIKNKKLEYLDLRVPGKVYYK